MLRFGLCLAIGLAAFSSVAIAEPAEKIAASQSKTDKSHRSRKERPVVTAQPAMVAPLPERKSAPASPVAPLPDTW